MPIGNADVMVLGSGLAGSIAALCLVRQGLSVLLIDQGTHPRFAIGESTTTPSSLWLRVLAERYGVPELVYLASAEGLTKNVATTCGIKNNFGFLYHRKGAERPERSWQAVIPQAFLGDPLSDGQSPHNEMHYFRQDVDAWLWSSALAAGAIGHPATDVRRIEFDDRGVRATTATGEVLTARFAIDASGYRSPIADQLQLRDRVPRLRSNSRTVCTHMIGVRPYEQLGLVPNSMARWSQGTLHHFFDGGWVWVIPFDNHRDSSNRLCSVGLSLDNARFPRREGISAEVEWNEFLADHPAVAAQFERAVAVRPWVHTGRLQYSSSRCVGDRYWLTSHAAFAIDALYSIGNANTFHVLATGIDLVLQMFAADDFRAERLEPLQELTEAVMRFQDRIVYGNYVSFRDPELLQIWISLWSLTDTARIRGVLTALVRYVRNRDRAELDRCIREPQHVLTGYGMRTGCSNTTQVLAELDGLCDLMQGLERGECTAEELRQRITEVVHGRADYGVNLTELGDAFSQMPWNLAPLASNSLRSYATCFLTPTEVNRLGLEQR